MLSLKSPSVAATGGNGLIARDVFVRKPAIAPLDRCIRVSCGPDDALEVFAEALADVMNVR